MAIKRKIGQKPFGFAYKTEIGSDKKMNNKPFIQYNYAAEEIIFYNMPISRTNLEGKADAYNAEGNRWVMLKIPGDILAKLDKKVLEIVNSVARPVRNSDGSSYDKIVRVRLPAETCYDHMRSPFLHLAAIKEYDRGTKTKIFECDIDHIFNKGNGDIIWFRVDSLLRSAVKTSMGARLIKIKTPRGTIPVLYMTYINIANAYDFRTEANQFEYYPFDVETYECKRNEFNTKEVQKVMPNNFDKVVVNGPATIAWINGKKVMVKKSEDDEYDYEKAMLALMVKSFFGNEARFHRWCKDNMKLINKAVKKDAKLSAEKAEKNPKKNSASKNKVGEQNSYNRWTKEEFDFLLANYKTMTNKELGEHLGRSYASVQTQLNRLRLTRG